MRRYGQKHCNVEECERPHKKYGYCTLHAKRFETYGDPLGSKKGLPPRGADGKRHCLVPECDNKYLQRGFCRKHYDRWKRFGNPTYYRYSNDERRKEFWLTVNVAGSSDDCWEWKGTRNSRNYGIFRYQTGNAYEQMAHRVAYFLHYGHEAGSLYVCHKCDNPPCCNPHHLFLGTAAENSADAQQKGRLVGGSGKKKLLRTEVDQIRQLLAVRMKHKAIADIFGVSRSCITAIAVHRNWSVKQSE